MIPYFRKLIVPTVILFWATCYYFEVMNKPKSAQVLIQPAYYLLCLLYVGICYTDYKSFKKAKSENLIKVKVSSSLFTGIMKKMLIMVMVTAVYLLSLRHIGFSISTFCFSFLSFSYLGAKSRALSFIASLAFTAFLYATFKTLLNVPLPAGLFWS